MSVEKAYVAAAGAADTRNNTGPVSHVDALSVEIYRREQNEIFRKVWLYVGRVEQVARPGEYFTKEIEVCETSVIVVRGQDKVLRAFHNLCSHRGARLVFDEDPRLDSAGQCPKFMCRFHGWRYGLDGRLEHVNSEKDFVGLDKSKLGLVPVAIDEWEGFIFVNMNPHPRQSLEEYLGPLAASLKGYPFSGATQVYGYRSVSNANWKLAVDPAQETYHLPYLHPDLIPGLPQGISNCACVHFGLEGLHRVYSLQHMPAQPGKQSPMEKLIGGNMYGKADEDGKGEDLQRQVRGLNPSRHPKWAADSFVFFPNFFLSLFERGGRYQTVTWWPLGPDHVRQELIQRFPPPRTASERLTQEMTQFAVQEFGPQDLNIIQGQHLGIKSGVRTHFQYGSQELMCRHFHESIARVLSGEDPC